MRSLSCRRRRGKSMTQSVWNESKTMSRPPPPPAPWINKGFRPRALVLGSGDRPNLRAEAERMRPLIDQHVEVVLEDLQYKIDLGPVKADFAIVLGGDGSILRAALQMQEVQF